MSNCGITLYEGTNGTKLQVDLYIIQQSFALQKNKTSILHKRLNQNRKEIYKSTDNKCATIE